MIRTIGKKAMPKLMRKIELWGAGSSTTHHETRKSHGAAQDTKQERRARSNTRLAYTDKYTMRKDERVTREEHAHRTHKKRKSIRRKHEKKSNEHTRTRHKPNIRTRKDKAYT